MDDTIKELLRKLADGETIQVYFDHRWVDLSVEGALRNLTNMAAGGFSNTRLRAKPKVTTRFIPIHRMPAGSLYLAEGKTIPAAAVDPGVNGHTEGDKLAAVLCVELDEELNLVSAFVDKVTPGVRTDLTPTKKGSS